MATLSQRFYINANIYGIKGTQRFIFQNPMSFDVVSQKPYCFSPNSEIWKKNQNDRHFPQCDSHRKHQRYVPIMTLLPDKLNILKIIWYLTLDRAFSSASISIRLSNSMDVLINQNGKQHVTLWRNSSFVYIRFC